MNNPLLDEYVAVMGPAQARRRHAVEVFQITGKFPPVNVDEVISPFTARSELVVTHAWAIPTERAVATIAEHSPNGVVEMGAGTGYWAWLLREQGVDVVAYDKAPYKNSHANGRWSDVLPGRPPKLSRHPERTLLLVWPPFWSVMAWNCLEHYAGSTVAYVGEGQGGCTGGDLFHDRLHDEFEQIAECAIPQWEGIHDYLTIHRRKGV